MTKVLTASVVLALLFSLTANAQNKETARGTNKPTSALSLLDLTYTRRDDEKGVPVNKRSRGQEAGGIHLDSDDLLRFARGVGHTLPKQLNSGVRRACLQKNHSPRDLPIAGWLRLSLHSQDSYKVKCQCLSLGVTAVPSDQWPTAIMNSVIGSGAP